MRTFAFDADKHATSYAERGYVHVRGGVDPEFLAYAQRETQRRLGQEGGQLHELRIPGKKTQFLFEFPCEEALNDAYRQVSVVTATPNDRLTLCERHIKVYDAEANASPPPHKDRVASQVAVGIPLSVAPGSHLALYPDHELTINPHTTSAQWRSGLDPEQLPEHVLKSVEPTRIDTRPGDAVIFRGASIYHERVNAAGGIVLYLKFNGLRLDPLGEDPGTAPLIERSRTLVRDSSDAELLQRRVEVSPRLTRISRHYTRLYWQQVIQASVEGEDGPVTLTEQELQLVQRIEDVMPVREVMRRLGIPEPRQLDAVPMFRRLARRGVLVLQ